MSTNRFSTLDPAHIDTTRAALHDYARVLGDLLKECRTQRKHWWHASLRPSLNGLTTGVVSAAVDFELELDLRNSLLEMRAATDARSSEPLRGQSAQSIRESVREFLTALGIESGGNAARGGGEAPAPEHPGYSAEAAQQIGESFGAVNASMVEFRSGIREETSPIQVWPHHFDLSMVWLPGERIPGQDPADGENADKQMNFGFTLGDDAIPNPYFYVTAYPLPDALPELPVPEGTSWNTTGFSGALLHYHDLLETPDPATFLLGWWRGLLAAGHEHMLGGDS